jgi:hypothetical protein
MTRTTKRTTRASSRRGAGLVCFVVAATLAGAQLGASCAEGVTPDCSGNAQCGPFGLDAADDAPSAEAGPDGAGDAASADAGVDASDAGDDRG